MTDHLPGSLSFCSRREVRWRAEALQVVLSRGAESWCWRSGLLLEQGKLAVCEALPDGESVTELCSPADAELALERARLHGAPSA